MATTVQVELQRRNQSNQLVPWTVNDDGTEPVHDSELQATLEALIASLQPQSLIWFQPTPEAIWLIPHTITHPPNVQVIRSDGTQVWATVQHIDSTHVQVSFSGAMSGTAYLS